MAAPSPAPSAVSPEYLEGLQIWRREKDRDLLRRDSWLALAGLFWLSQGRHIAGSDESASIRLPLSSPPHLGTFDVVADAVFFHPAGSLPIDGLPPAGSPLQPDTSDDPTYLRLGDLTLVLIARDGRLGLRVWDNARLIASTFPGRRWFDPDPGFVIEAAFVPAAEDATIPVPDVTGAVTETLFLGTAHFTLGQRPISLRAVPNDARRLWFLFGDPTNGSTTYPAGRFLVAGPAQDGRLVLDFNRAYNPPCAFTPYATCPLPPQGNRLSTSIHAGEMYCHES